MSQSFAIDSLTVGPFATNVYVFACLETSQSVIIDAGGNAGGLLRLARSNDQTLIGIWQTHAHIDHVAALTEIKGESQAPIYLHKLDLPLYESAEQQGLMFGYPCPKLPPVDHFVEDGDVLTVGHFSAKVLLLPGHSPGSIAFYFEDLKTIFSGDVLFAGSMGRVDLPGASPAAMRKSLARLRTLPDDVRVLSGHGPETTIGLEKTRNPYFQEDGF